MVDYWPRRLDLAALKAGNLAEVLNLAPWGNVLLQLPPLRLSGAHGWAALGAALGDHWLKDITTNQVRLGPMLSGSVRSSAVEEHRRHLSPSYCTQMSMSCIVPCPRLKNVPGAILLAWRPWLKAHTIATEANMKKLRVSCVGSRDKGQKGVRAPEGGRAASTQQVLQLDMKRSCLVGRRTSS